MIGVKLMLVDLIAPLGFLYTNGDGDLVQGFYFDLKNNGK
jgi:hypothetical protein